MQSTKRTLLCLGALLVAACGNGTGEPGDGLSALSASEFDEFPEDTPGDERDPPTLDCPRGGPTGAIHVAFECDSVTVTSCKDLSNVVLEFEDGSRQRFEGLNGHEAAFSGTLEFEDAVITRVWVKAGANASGDGPGYGERFEAPADSCERDAPDGPDDPDEGEPNEPDESEPPPEEPSEPDLF